MDSDWIEIVTKDDNNLRIDQAGDEVDDRIGPMVNHQVVVYATQIGDKFNFLDIEADEIDAALPSLSTGAVSISNRPSENENGFQNPLI